MSKISSLLLSGFLILLISIPGFGAVKNIRENELQVFITDCGDQSEFAGDPNIDVIKFYEGVEEVTSDAYPQATAWNGDMVRCAGSRFGCVNWWDPETGNILPIKLAGSPYGTPDHEENMFTVPDENQISIKRHFRYHPPRIIVDGLELQEPFPRVGDDYGSNKVWGTADVMVESHFRNWMGLDIYQRILVWAQKNHDDYVIYDWTIVNSGNVDQDEEIERDGEPIEDLYFMRQLEIMPNNEHWGKREWFHWTGVYPPPWDDPEDSVRMVYAYGALDFNWFNPQYDALGCFDFARDYLDDVCSGGEVTLYVPTSPDDAMGPGPNAVNGVVENHPETDDVTQPKAHGIRGPDDLEFKQHSGMRPPEDWQIVYNSMIYGEKGDARYDPFVEYMTGTYPNTYHPTPTDRRGYARWMDLNGPGTVFWHAVCNYTSGPFDLAFGDSIRIVWATTGGTLPPKSCWDIGHAWKDTSITFTSEFSGELDVNDVSLTYPYLPDLRDTIYIPPTYRHHEWRWQEQNTGYADDRANLLKDMWVYTTVDTVIRNAINAQWNFDNNYDIPSPPPPPSIEVTSLPERINISWWYEDASDAPSDLAGFKVYRAIANSGPIIVRERDYIGEWELIYQAGPGESSFDDVTASRGENYYYYVAAFDDTTSGEIGILGRDEALESGRWQNNTSIPASLTKSSGEKLSDIRVVPNPCNVTAQFVQYRDAPYKINFVNLPPVCTIKIYNFSGDLMTVLEHTDGSGDEAWTDPTGQYYLTTSSQQVVVSGVYIAYIETPSGESTTVKFVIVR
jgi:hypothetical protein